MKKYTVILLLMIFAISCATTKNGNSKTLKLESASKQAFVLGIEHPEGKSAGVTYSMYFDSKADIKVEKLWINGKNLDFENVKTNAKGSFRIRGTLYNKYKKNIHENVKEPIEHSGEGLLQYNENGETKYYIIPAFKRFEKTIGN